MKECLLFMERYNFAETFEIKEVNGKKMIALNGYFYTGSSAFLWHKEERNIVTPIERFLKWKSRNPNSPEYEEYILKRRVKIRHMNRDEAEHELIDFNPKPLNLVSVDENTPCGHYIDMTFAD